MSMPISSNVPVQPTPRIGNGACPTNSPPPAASTAVPLGERSVNVVRPPVPAPAVPTAARMQSITPDATLIGSQPAERPKRKRMAPSSTVAPSPTSTTPKKKTNNNNRKMPVEMLVERLQHGSRHRLKKGWYCAQERSKRAAAGREEENGKKRLSRTEKQQLLSEVLLLESYNKYKPEVVHRHGQHGKFLKTSATSKGATLQYLGCSAWGLASNYICRLKKKAMAEDGSISCVLPASPDKSDTTNYEHVISNRELAKSIYTAKKLFALDQCRHEKNNTSLDLLQGQTKQGYNQRHAIALDQYDHLTTEMRLRWEMEARGHDEEQPLIKSRIIEMLKQDPKISWESLELGIARWCSASTIRRWITSFDSFQTYCERVVPSLSDQQRQSQSTFAGRFRKN